MTFRVLIINGHDRQGGAAQVAHRLAQGLHHRDHQIQYLVQKKTGNEPWAQTISTPPGPNARSLRARALHRLGINSLSLASSFPLNLSPAFLRSFDVIHLHDIQGMGFNIAGLAYLSAHRPVVWTLHSAWPVTGNCIYPYTCPRYRRYCGQCPQFGQFPLQFLHRDASRLNNIIKRLIYQHSNLYIVGVSRWIARLARQGMLARFPQRVVLNPAEVDLYQPVSKNQAKQQLGISTSKRTILFSIAGNVLDTRKGVDVILQALKQLPVSREWYLLPLSITPPSEELQSLLEKFPHRPVQYVSGRRELYELYNAADVIWHPSRADNAPLTILEAGVARSVVVASAVGGVPELIDHQKTGVLIAPDDPQALAQATKQLFQDSRKLERMGQAARKHVEKNFSLDHFLDRHEELYHDVIRSWKRRRI